MENVLDGKILDHDVKVWFTGMIDSETKEQSMWAEIMIENPDGLMCSGRFRLKWTPTTKYNPITGIES